MRVFIELYFEAFSFSMLILCAFQSFFGLKITKSGTVLEEYPHCV